MTILVYSKPQCVQCTATIKSLQSRGLKHTVIDLTQDESAMKKVLELGYRQAPVVVSDQTHWSGFRPDMINQIRP